MSIRMANLEHRATSSHTISRKTITRQGDGRMEQ